MKNTTLLSCRLQLAARDIELRYSSWYWSRILRMAVPIFRYASVSRLAREARTDHFGPSKPSPLRSTTAVSSARRITKSMG